MKRSGPLRRKTPLTPGGPLKRKTRMKQVNPKTAKIRRQARDPRAQYVAEHFTCQVCHKRQATECHEIVRRSTKANSILYRSTYIATCYDCHENELGDYSRYPIARQLAVKLISDGDHFNLEEINRLRGRDANAITLTDVAKYLQLK
jgi:cytochrome c553